MGCLPQEPHGQEGKLRGQYLEYLELQGKVVHLSYLSYLSWIFFSFVGQVQYFQLPN